MEETKTTNGGAHCPTLLHYLARTLLRTDPSVIQFIEDLPNLEPAARGAHPYLLFQVMALPLIPVSVQTITQAVNTLVSGLGQIKDEIKQLQQVGLPADDRFVHVMQVSCSPFPTSFR